MTFKKFGVGQSLGSFVPPSPSGEASPSQPATPFISPEEAERLKQRTAQFSAEEVENLRKLLKQAK